MKSVKADAVAVLDDPGRPRRFPALSFASPQSSIVVLYGKSADSFTMQCLNRYLTTSDKYDQRLVIVNRGTADTEYRLTFALEDGTTAKGGDGAEGMVAAGERKVLASGTTTCGDAHCQNTYRRHPDSEEYFLRSQIDVAAVQTRTGAGPDTVIYQVE